MKKMIQAIRIAGIWVWSLLALIGLFSVCEGIHAVNCDHCKAQAKWAQDNGCDYFWCPAYSGK